MLFIVYTTGRCNLRCGYCGGSFEPEVVPWKVRYPVEWLEELIEKDDSVAFYGGEPLLNPDFIREVMDRVGAGRWIIQTNGLLLPSLGSDYLNRMDAILVSVDGPEWLTDRFRGRGVYRRVLGNLRRLREEGFRGDLIARMTVTELSDIYRDVCHLLDLNLFDHVHWQLSFVWTEPWHNLWGWIEEVYKPGLRRLMERWIEGIKHGVVEGIAPFQGILGRILMGGPTPPCGSGTDSFTILTDGRIVACPIAVREEWAEVGRLPITREELKRYRPPISEPCLSCPYFKVCGARCLYTHVERLWGEEGVEAVCSVSKYIVDLVEEHLPEILRSIEAGIIPLNDLIYPSYNNTIEIMP